MPDTLSTSPGVNAPAEVDDAARAAVRVLDGWLAMSEVQRRALDVLVAEILGCSDMVEDSTIELSDSFRALVAVTNDQTQRIDNIIDIVNQQDARGPAPPEPGLDDSLIAELRAASDASGEMNRSISRLVMGMQFQDRFKQRLEHIIDAMRFNNETLSALEAETSAQVPASRVDRQRVDGLISDILGSIRMDEVRKRMVARLLRDGEASQTEGADWSVDHASILDDPGDGDEDDGIELF